MRFSKFLIVQVLMLLSMVACNNNGSDDMPDMEDSRPDNVVYLRLSLLAPTASSTRTNPTGGEDGDGREDALDRENRIYDINLFFYHGGDNGDGVNQDNPEAIPVKHHEYVSSDSQYGFQVSEIKDNAKPYIAVFDKLVEIKDYIPEEGDWMMVVANAGEIANVSNLSELREKVFVDGSWEGDKVNTTTRFTMATARTNGEYFLNDGKVIVGENDGSEKHPFSSRTVIERTAARIDFFYHEDNVKNGVDGLEYAVKIAGEDNKIIDTGNKVVITNIIPVNLNSAPSFWFKRVTEGLDIEKFYVCRSEQLSENRLPKNYVLDPNTISGVKTFGNATTDIKGNPSAFFNEMTKISAIRSNGEIGSDDWENFNTYSILCYANENTHIRTDRFTPGNLTGLAFKAQYVPGKVYGSESVDASGNLVEGKSGAYTKGATLWRFVPSHDGEGKDVSDLECIYFTDEVAANRYKEHNPKFNGVITEYPGGVCYYTLWIKHANYESATTPDPQEPFEMQYGIVRNNIYRIGVSFSGPGDSEPKMNGPLNMRPKIFVRKWNLREEDSIIF